MNLGLQMSGGMCRFVYSSILVAQILTISQLKLPQGAQPLFFLLYSDKNNLSSFGTVKTYPVIVRCLNLPLTIRNAKGTGGGRIVGWLPVVRGLFFLEW